MPSTDWLPMVGGPLDVIAVRSAADETMAALEPPRTALAHRRSSLASNLSSRQDRCVAVPHEQSIRAAALAWIDMTTLGGTIPVTREQLANDFTWQGERFPLVDRGRGIRRPAGWHAALSITTSAPKTGRSRPYEDDEGPDGLHRYKLRRDDGGATENEGLRAALREQLPLIWFYGLQAGVFNAIYPVYFTAEETDQFVLALTDAQRSVPSGSPVEETLRRYLISETKRRLHQPVFASQVMLAYDTHCAVCALHHRELLDAAHIIPDSKPHGAPLVPNGLALCKIHHAAYDRNILGIRPDYVVEIHHRLLDEIDGPMLRHGLQEHHEEAAIDVAPSSGRPAGPEPTPREVRRVQSGLSGTFSSPLTCAAPNNAARDEVETKRRLVRTEKVLHAGRRARGRHARPQDQVRTTRFDSQQADVALPCSAASAE